MVAGLQHGQMLAVTISAIFTGRNMTKMVSGLQHGQVLAARPEVHVSVVQSAWNGRADVVDKPRGRLDDLARVPGDLYIVTYI